MFVFGVWIPLDRVRGHFCVFHATPLCLVVVFAVGNDAADIYPFTNTCEEFSSLYRCTVPLKCIFFILYGPEVLIPNFVGSWTFLSTY